MIYYIWVRNMNNKMIKTLLILLSIMIVISVIISIVFLKKPKDNGFSSSTNYGNTVETKTTSVPSKNNSEAWNTGDDILDYVNKKYTIIIIISVIMIIIFVIFYFALTKKKEW